MRRAAARVALAAAVLLLAAAGAAAWWASLFYGGGPLKEERLVLLEPGAGVGGIARRLEEAGVIESGLAFEIGAALSGESLKAGEYLFSPGISAVEALEKIRRGEVYLRRLTVPEGLTTAQALALVAEATGLTGPLPDKVPEGALLPETYTYTYGESRQAMVERMREAMAHLLAELWLGRAPELPLDSPEEAVILASIVEKETGLAEERARVAAVFLNRLTRGMPLQSDPTVVYALTEGEGPLGRPLTRADLGIDSPYNSYRVPGLPPTAIANPGRAALEAVLHPLATDELYFVATGDGGHVFSRTLEEHNANVRRYRTRESEGAAGAAQSP